MKVVYLGPEDTLDFVRERLPDTWRVDLVLSEAEADLALPDATGILDAYMRVSFPAARLARAPRLRAVVTATTGANHIDEKYLASRKIPLLTLRGQKEVLRNITPAAEHSWLLMMACARGLRGAIDGVLAGEWDRNKHPGTMLRGRRLGLIGCGRIGQWMARYGAAFGMDVVGYDPYADPWPKEILRRDLDVVLSTSDFISIHVSLDDENHGLLGPRELGLIKTGAVFVNTSRGELLDESALLSALREGRIAAGALDVMTAEPNIADDPLLVYAREHQNLIITPHIGGFSPDALRYVLDFSCKRLRDELERC